VKSRSSPRAAFEVSTAEAVAISGHASRMSIQLLTLPYDIYFRVFDFCLADAGQVSLMRISREARSGITRNPFVPESGGVGSPTSNTVESRGLSYKNSILQTYQDQSF
jgi:hypothetical protein